MNKFILTGFLCLLLSTPIFTQEVGEGKISGLMFGDYFYNILRDSTIDNLNNTGLSGIQDLQGFDFRRIYFTYDYTISEEFSTRFRVESQTLVSVDNTLFLTYIKDAYLNWKNIFKGSNFIFGIQPTPAFVITEDYWGYRSLERTIMDLRRIVSSRDFGASLKGRLTSSGSIKYWLMYGNGSVLGEEADKFKRLYSQVDLQPAEEWRVTLYGDYRFKANKEYTQVDENFNNDALTTDIFLGYQQKDNFTIGAESFWQIIYNDAIQTTETDYIIQNRNALGISLFGFYNFSKMITGVGRYDYYDPNISGDYRGDSRNLFILGLSFNLNEKVAITPNFLFETYEQPENGVTLDPSLTGRITFYFQFL
ncbi:MAG: hypothetical protein ACHQLA_07750 [Ignavibacteriales bacterium]